MRAQRCGGVDYIKGVASRGYLLPFVGGGEDGPGVVSITTVEYID